MVGQSATCTHDDQRRLLRLPGHHRGRVAIQNTQSSVYAGRERTRGNHFLKRVRACLGFGHMHDDQPVPPVCGRVERVVESRPLPQRSTARFCASRAAVSTAGRLVGEPLTPATMRLVAEVFMCSPFAAAAGRVADTWVFPGLQPRPTGARRRRAYRRWCYAGTGAYRWPAALQLKDADAPLR